MTGWQFVPLDWFLQAASGSMNLDPKLTPMDALEASTGPLCWRIVDGDLAWSLDATMTLHEFACLEAEDALRLNKVTDQRSWKAIRVKRQWMRGQASDSELAAARAATWAAARTAAWAAAWAATSAAARTAAWAAAWAAARAAAWAAAWAAARAAAWAAAWAAARRRQSRRLHHMLLAAHRADIKLRAT